MKVERDFFKRESLPDFSVFATEPALGLSLSR